MTDEYNQLSDEALRRELRKAHRMAEHWRLRLRGLITEARERNWTQQKIGDVIGVSQSAISQRLQQRPDPTTE